MSSSSPSQLIYCLISVFKDAIDSSSEYYTSNSGTNSSTDTASSCILIGEYFRGLTINMNGNFVGSFSGTTSQQHAQIIRQTCLSIGEKISHVNHKRTLTQASINFHYKVVDNKYLFLVCSDAECPMRVCYNFIDDVETQFKRQGLTTNNSLGNQSYKAISNIIKDRMAHYNNFENDKIYKLKNQIDATKDVMISNIDKVIERGEKLETLVERTEQLQDQAFGFRGKSKKLKNVMRKRIVIISIICILILVIVAIVAVFAGCNFPSFDRCRSTTTNSNNNKQ